MLKSVFFLLRFVFFWLIFFAIEQLIFLLFFYKKLKNISFNEILKSFVYGIPLNLSTTGYIFIIPLLVFFIFCNTPKIKLAKKITIIYTKFFIILFSLLCIINLNIYDAWGSKVNYKVFEIFFNYPKEALASSMSSPLLLSFFIFIALVWIGFILSKKIINYKIPEPIGIIPTIIVGMICVGITFLFIRGGWQLTPINESKAYYSQHNLLNHATVNTEWCLIRDLLNKNNANKNSYSYIDGQKAKQVIDSNYMINTNTAVDFILKNKKVNVVFIIVEGFTANVIEDLGGEKNITPCFKQLSKKGILFTNAYATGDRTSKGFIGTLSGFPSQGRATIITENNKQEKLPSIVSTMAEQGYYTSFYYGGESEFDNYKSYMLSHGCKKIIDKNSFSSQQMNSKWGAHDGVVFEKQLLDLKTMQQPFFSTLLTLTNHEPFELPVLPHFKEKDNADKFRNTAYYTDSCLDSYLQKASKEPWYQNTLFVIVADHSVNWPTQQYDIFTPQRFHIPILFYGGAIQEKYQGKQINKVVSQVDIVKTVLCQMNLNADKFKWSRNMLDNNPIQFAFYTWDDGFGYTTPEQTISLNTTGNNIIFRKNNQPHNIDSALENKGKAILQTVYQEYLDY